MEMGRTNYFRVKTPGEFKKQMARLGLKVITSGKAFGVHTEGEEGWPAYYEDARGNEVDFAISAVIAEHLQDGEVAVVISLSYDKMRYLSGQAEAFTNQTFVSDAAPLVRVSLSDIYKLAEVAFGKVPTGAEL